MMPPPRTQPSVCGGTHIVVCCLARVGLGSAKFVRVSVRAHLGRVRPDRPGLRHPNLTPLQTHKRWTRTPCVSGLKANCSDKALSLGGFIVVWATSCCGSQAQSAPHCTIDRTCSALHDQLSADSGLSRPCVDLFGPDSNRLANLAGFWPLSGRGGLNSTDFGPGFAYIGQGAAKLEPVLTKLGWVRPNSGGTRPDLARRIRQHSGSLQHQSWGSRIWAGFDPGAEGP